MSDNSRAINRVFTRGVILGLLQNGSNDVFDVVVRRYINDPGSKTHGEIISEIYSHLGKEKRNEYFFVNTLLNKILSIHNVNTTTALSQVRIARHVADFVMINGEAKLYEIKSELDNFDRLYEQLSDYYKAFSKVSVLSSIRELDKIKLKLAEFGEMGQSVGIYVLSENDTIFSKIHSREPKQFDAYLDHGCIFKLLRKHEYESVIKQYFEETPQVAPVFHFKAYFEMFNAIPMITAQALTFEELKKRNKITRTVFDKIQNELKSVIYFSGLSRKWADVERLLQTQYRG